MMLYKLLSELDRRRFASTVISMTELGTTGRRIAELGIPVRLLGIDAKSPGPGGLLRLVALLEREEPDILQTWLYDADLLGYLASRLRPRSALLWNIRCTPRERENHARHHFLTRTILPTLSSRPHAIIVNSEAGKRLHSALGYRPARWAVIPNGFDLDLFRPSEGARRDVRLELGLPIHTPLIGLLARYDPMKDHATFVEAARLFATLRPDVRFLLAGRDVNGHNPELARLVAEAGLGRSLYLLGERSDVPRFAAALDVLALTSAYGEGFPNVVGEAMASGVPCAVTAVGDSAEIVGGTGRIVPPRDPVALAEAWREILHLSPDARRALGLAARTRIGELFSLSVVARRYEALYERISEESP